MGHGRSQSGCIISVSKCVWCDSAEMTALFYSKHDKGDKTACLNENSSRARRPLRYGGTAVEFCEKCGALMLPKRKEGKKPVLKCRECGHEKRIGSSPEYKVEYRVKHSPREKIVVVEGTDNPKDEMSGDERRERRKAILEHFESED